MKRPFRRVASVVALIAIAAGSSVALIGSEVPPAQADTASTVSSAVSWLRTQQQSDGGFEVAGFPGFETPDAVFALAQAAQSGSWNPAAARAAVLGTSNAAGKTPLDNIDAYASSGMTAGKAGKLIALVTNPLGLDPTTFDPSGNGATNLVSGLGSPGGDNKWGISTGALNQILFATWGYGLVNGSAPSATIAVITGCQKPSGAGAGSWTFDCDTSTSVGDIDTTSYAMLSLLAAGVSASDPAITSAVTFLDGTQQGDGAWQAFGSDDPNSTGVALLALSAISGQTTPVANGSTWLASQQQSDGRIASPNDGFGINTSATAQAIEGLQHVTVPRVTSFVTPKTVPTATGGGSISLDTSSGTLQSVTAIAPSTLPTVPGVSFPRGLVGYTITGLTSGASTTVRVVLPVGTTPTSYWKYLGGAWQDFTSHASFAGNVVTLTLTDGGAGDSDGLANGTIVDPGGPGIAVAVTSDPGLVARFTG